MIIGTTPTHKFIFPEEVTNITEIHVIYSQGDRIILVKTLEDCTIEGNEIKVRLTQEETFRFRHDSNIDIQLRVRKGNDVFSSEITTVEPYKCLEREILE